MERASSGSSTDQQQRRHRHQRVRYAVYGPHGPIRWCRQPGRGESGVVAQGPGLTGDGFQQLERPRQRPQRAAPGLVHARIQRADHHGGRRRHHLRLRSQRLLAIYRPHHPTRQVSQCFDEPGRASAIEIFMAPFGTAVTERYESDAKFLECGFACWMLDGRSSDLRCERALYKYIYINLYPGRIECWSQ